MTAKEILERYKAGELTREEARKLLEAASAAPAGSADAASPAPSPAASPAPAAGSPNDIAVIGMACRFPKAPSLAAFWELLAGGRDAVSDVPPDRWDWRRHSASRFGAFVDEVDRFDSQFFEISPREARLIDPQQRIFLETAWEALEHGGYAGAALSGADVGVFVGSTNRDYFYRISRMLGPDDYAAALGNLNAVIPNRLSYLMNFRGPSMLVDTTCSSSLVAVHTACESLRRGECTAAVAGGVNIMLSADHFVTLKRLGVQSTKGQCRAFDDGADGFVSGEGAAVLLLKPLARALADRDAVYAVIKGSAVNHDGRSNGLAAPNPRAHADVIARAHAAAGVAAESISYVEAHGTGTRLGDPVEMQGLTAAFARSTQRRQFCAVGSVKTNIGHLEPAAGIAGVIKVILSLVHRELPKSLHFEKLNEHISLEETPFFVNHERRAWKSDGPRRAGVSSFGMSGTNAHAVLEEAPPAAMPATRAAAARGAAYVLPLSARTEPALQKLALAYAAHLEAHPDASLGDVCFTAAVGRAHHGHRLALVATDRASLIARLRAAGSTAALAGAEADGIVHAHVKPDARADGPAPSLADPAALAQRYTRAWSVDVAPWQGEFGRVALPTYPFERQRHWVDGPEATAEPAPAPAPAPAETQAPSDAPKVHPFLRPRG